MRVARDLMPPRVLTVRPEASMAECARLFLEHDVRHLPVVDEHGALLGVLTEEGVYRWGALAGEPRIWVPFHADEPLAGEVAEPVDVVFHPGDALAEVVARLNATRQDAAVGVDGGKVVGLLTEHDLVWLAQWVAPEDQPVSVLASRPVYTVQRSEPAKAAWRHMSEHGVRHVLVMDGRRLYGVLSVRDIIAEDILHGRELTAQEVWRGGPLHVVDPAASVCDAAQLMVSYKVGCLPVVDDDGHVQGIITRADVIAAMDGRLPEEGVRVPSS